MSSTPARWEGCWATTPTLLPSMRANPDYDVAGERLMHLHKVAVIHYALDDIRHIVGRVRAVGDDVEESVVRAGRIVGCVVARRVFHIVLRQEAQQAANFLEAGLFRVGRKVRDSAAGRVAVRAAKLFVSYLFASDRSDDVGAGDVHLPGATDHENEVGEGGGVGRAPGCRAENDGNLGNHTG